MCLQSFSDAPKATALLLLLFADDSTACDSHKDLDTLFANVNQELKKLEDWFNANALTVNASKTRYICYTNKSNCPDLWLSGQKIMKISDDSEERAFKLLGVWLDPSLTFKYHINEVHKSIRIAIAYILRSRKSLPMNIRVMIFKSLALSHVNYSNDDREFQEKIYFLKEDSIKGNLIFFVFLKKQVRSQKFLH